MAIAGIFIFENALVLPIFWLNQTSVEPNRIYQMPKLQLGIIQFSRIEKYQTEYFGIFLIFFQISFS